MSRFDELLAEGRSLTREQRAEALKRLLLHPNAAALVVLVREQWEQFAEAASDQKLAPHKGCLEHCAGSLHGVRCVENSLRSAINSAEKKKAG